MKVLIQLRSTSTAHAAALGFAPSPAVTAGVATIAGGLTIDPVYPPVQVPGIKTTSGVAMRSLGQPLTFSMAPLESTYVVRGQIPDGSAQPAALAAAVSHPDVVGVYSDPLIESCITCGSTPAIGASSKVANLLSLTKLKNKGMDGKGVFLAIVDTGINVAHLKSKGRSPALNAAKSWTPSGVATTAGHHPLDHGTMCAYDAGIMAPKATLLDYAVLLSHTAGATPMTGLLSDAVLAYSKLRTILSAMPAGKRSMVISNSWGMYSPTWDFPPGHPGNYSDNPNHPFNIIVSSLEAAGADILFAAGNCGRDCMDGRCNFASDPPICGANSSPAVLCVAGVDVKKARVGYSSQGPGRLTAKKPDFATYTHFSGSEAFGAGSADSGTSAACPVAAGVIAAIRTKYPSTKLSPLQLRSLISKTAEDLGGVGFDLNHGWGLLDVGALLRALP
jgi:subtilisin family serine protease